MMIRPAVVADHPALLDLWLRSVRATHRFLTEADIQSLYPLVRDVALSALELWVLERDGKPVGFSGLDGSRLEALFIDPDHTRLGGGRMLVEHARHLRGPLAVDVNEGNPESLAFYQSMGFEVFGRSETDSGGRPFPLLHLRDQASGAASAAR